MATGHLWFKARRYGWGWEPASREGWRVLLAFLAVVAVSVCVFLYSLRAGVAVGWATVAFLLWMALLTGVLTAIARLTGEPPRWRWGD